MIGTAIVRLGTLWLDGIRARERGGGGHTHTHTHTHLHVCFLPFFVLFFHNIVSVVVCFGFVGFFLKLFRSDNFLFLYPRIENGPITYVSKDLRVRLWI